jgi:serine/threonine protein kinase/uncharacterized RDD family membrane protein YckC
MTRCIEAGDRVGEYVLESKVGRGSFGEVWKARHRALEGLAVAMKFPSDARALARLRGEGALARRIEHETVVKLVGLDLEHDPPYLAMQFIDGESLREVLRRGALPPRRALAVARRIYAALEAAHGSKVIHRDVKPENILIDAAGKAYLGDFGLAAAFDGGSSTELGSLGSRGTGVVGTLRYLSPEQKDPRRAIDPRSDLYSAGLVLFEMLTGVLPEGGELPSDLVPGLEKAFDSVFARCYARLERRFKSAREVLEALGELEAAIEPPRIVVPKRSLGLEASAVRLHDTRLVSSERSPSGHPNLIAWEEARAILRVSDAELQRFVDKGAIARSAHQGRLLFRRSDVVELRGRMRRILTPEGLEHYVLPRRAVPVAPPSPPTPTLVETATSAGAYPWLAPAPALRPAGALVRALAFAVDALAIAALATVVGTEVFSGPALLVTYVLGGTQLCLAPGVLDAASVAVLAFLYFSILTGLLGRTFGKWIFALRVTDPRGEPIGVGRSAARTLGYVVSATPLGLGFLGVLLHPEHRGFHDLVADSVVSQE